MRRLLGILIIPALIPAIAGAQVTSAEDVNTARISAASFADTAINRVIGRIGVDLVEAVPNRGMFMTSMGVVEDQGSLHLSRGFARWEGVGNEGAGSNATLGTFFYQPQMFENRAGNVYMPAVLVNGFQSQLHMGRITVEAFAGKAAAEEGSRILYIHGTSDRMAGMTATIKATPHFSFGFQAARTMSNPSDASVVRAFAAPSSSVQLRQAAQWKPSQWLTVTGEFGATKAGRSLSTSYDASVEHDGSRLSFRAAYVHRSTNYLPFGLLSFSAGRQG
ncbi:MAG TPA: hypothetical protein VKY31_17255, partial [Terriglobia bacterium]|nr:hypothetical protein [Terriglobia bacterium]